MDRNVDGTEAAMWAEYWKQRAVNPQSGATYDAKNALTLLYLPTTDEALRKLCGYRRPPGVDIWELASMVWDVIASKVPAFTPELARDIPFDRWISRRCRGAIIDAARNAGHISRAHIRFKQIAEGVAQEYRATYGQSPDDAQFAAALEQVPLSPNMMKMGGREKIKHFYRVINPSILSIDSPLQNGYTHASIMATAAPGVKHRSDMEVNDILDALHLHGPDRTVIKLYYFEGRTMKDIGGMLAFCESRVSQIHNDIIKRMRHDPAARRILSEAL